MAALGAAFAAFLLVDPVPVQLRWFLIGAAVTAIGSAAWRGIELTAGVHHRALGYSAERSTRRGVYGLRRRIRGWRVVEGLYFDCHGDVDHVLVGPGGIYAIESKWTTRPWTIEDGDLAGWHEHRDPIEQARHGAHKIQLLLRHGAERLDVSVHPILVVWGPGVPSIPGHAVTVRGVTVVEGRWLELCRRRVFGMDQPKRAVSASALRILQTLRASQS